MAAISSLIALEGQRWRGMKITRNYSNIAKQIANHKDVYLAVSARTGVPWFLIGCWHIREASGIFSTQLAQGDPLSRVSTHVPKGRGPFPGENAPPLFKAWQAGALDALINCNPKAANWHDWSAGGSLTITNEYNGLGYWYHNMPSPYVWAGTNCYSRGKFTSDGHLDLNVVDNQPGVANLIWHLQQIDNTVRFFDQPDPAIAPQTQKGMVVVPMHPASAPSIVPSNAPPSISHPAAGSVGAKLVEWFHALEKRV